MGSITKLVYRAFTTIYLCLYGLVVGYVNKVSLKWPYIIGGVVLLVCYMLSISFAPKYYNYVTLDLSRRVNFYNFYIGNYSYVTYAFSFFADIVSFVIFISYIPTAMKDKSQVYLTLIFLVAFMFVACFYSLIREHNKILQLLKSKDEYNVNVRSFFHSKNAFGLYLFVAEISAGFLLAMLKIKWKWLLIIPMIFFSTMPFFAMCKTALVCCLIFNILLAWYFSFFSKGISSVVGIIISSLTIICFVCAVLLAVMPSIQKGLLLDAYNLLQKLFKGVFTRTERWVMVKYVVQGPFMVIGMNETNTTFYLNIMSIVLQNSDIDNFHSAFVTWYAYHGIIGSIIYGGLLLYIIYKVIIVIRKERALGFLLSAIFVTCFVFMIPESYTLFVSTSSYSFIINLLLICVVEFLTKKEKGAPDEV